MTTLRTSPGAGSEQGVFYYSALVGANPYGAGANGTGTYKSCIQGSGELAQVALPDSRLIVSVPHLDMSSGQPKRYSVKLNAPPSSDVHVYMNKLGGEEYVVSPEHHTFTDQNWNDPQWVTVERCRATIEQCQGQDYSAPDDVSFGIVHDVYGGDYARAVAHVDVNDRVPQWMVQRGTEPTTEDRPQPPAGQNRPAIGGPGIDGITRDSGKLRATTWRIEDEDGLNNAIFTFQWLRDAVEIAGANSATYTVTSADRGKGLQVRVTFTDDAGHEETLYSYTRYLTN